MLLDWSPTCETQPHTTSSTMSGSMPARSTSAVTTRGERSAACISDRPPLRLPTGVRTASAMTVSRIRGLHFSAIRRADGPLFAQFLDLVGPEAEFGKDGVGVLAKAGDGSHPRVVSGGG